MNMNIKQLVFLFISIFSTPLAFGAYEPDTALMEKLNTAKRFLADLQIEKAKRSKNHLEIKRARFVMHCFTFDFDPQIIERKKQILLTTSGVSPEDIKKFTSAFHEANTAMFENIKAQAKTIDPKDFPIPIILSEGEKPSKKEQEDYLKTFTEKHQALITLTDELELKYPALKQQTQILQQEIQNKIEATMRTEDEIQTMMEAPCNQAIMNEYRRIAAVRAVETTKNDKQ